METTPADATLAALKRERLAHRLVGNFGFSHVGRSLDAVQYVRNNKSSKVTFVGGRVVEGGFQPAGALAKVKTWVRAGYFRSTGDGDPSDDRHATFFQALPTPRVYARFPFYNLMNNEDVFAQLQLKPHARLNLRADVRLLRLSNADDLWYAGRGAFQEASFGYQGRPSSGRRSLGTLFDLSADVNLTPTTTLTLYGAGVCTGHVAVDECRAGSFYLSLGENRCLGGRNASTLNVDLIA